MDVPSALPVTVTELPVEVDNVATFVLLDVHVTSFSEFSGSHLNGLTTSLMKYSVFVALTLMFSSVFVSSCGPNGLMISSSSIVYV